MTISQVDKFINTFDSYLQTKMNEDKDKKYTIVDDVKKIRETYRFAVNSAVQITFFSTGLVGFLTYFFFEFSFKFCLIFAVCIALFSFLLLQFKVQEI